MARFRRADDVDLQILKSSDKRPILRWRFVMVFNATLIFSLLLMNAFIAAHERLRGVANAVRV